MFLCLIYSMDPSFLLHSLCLISRDQWGRRLEVWPNTADVICTWFCTACLFCTVSVALILAAHLRADGMEFPAAACYIVIVHNHPSWATSCKEGMAWYSIRPMPSLWFNQSRAMIPKARGITQQGGPPGWLKESDPAECDFVRDGRSMPPTPWRT